MSIDKNRLHALAKLILHVSAYAEVNGEYIGFAKSTPKTLNYGLTCIDDMEYVSEKYCDSMIETLSNVDMVEIIDVSTKLMIATMCTPVTNGQIVLPQISWAGVTRLHKQYATHGYLKDCGTLSVSGVGAIYEIVKIGDTYWLPNTTGNLTSLIDYCAALYPTTFKAKMKDMVCKSLTSKNNGRFLQAWGLVLALGDNVPCHFTEYCLEPVTLKASVGWVGEPCIVITRTTTGENVAYTDSSDTYKWTALLCSCIDDAISTVSTSKYKHLLSSAYKKIKSLFSTGKGEEMLCAFDISGIHITVDYEHTSYDCEILDISKHTGKSGGMLVVRVINDNSETMGNMYAILAEYPEMCLIPDTSILPIIRALSSESNTPAVESSNQTALAMLKYCNTMICNPAPSSMLCTCISYMQKFMTEDEFDSFVKAIEADTCS